MAEVLSQQEIDQLLTGISTGEIKEDQLANLKKNREISEYDFRRPNRVSKDQLKTIRTLHENFSETFGFYLASKLQTMTTIDLVAVDQLRYSEYVLSISNPSCLYLFDIEETKGRAILELTPELVLVIVERLLGGSGSKVKANRSITPIEQRMMKPIITQVLKNLTNAWKPIRELHFSLQGFESNPDFVQIAPAGEIVIVVSFEIKIGEDSYLTNLCYPSFALEEVISNLNVQFFSALQSKKERGQDRVTLSQHLEKTRLDVRVVLGKTHLSLRELLGLEVGDVLVLDNELEDDVEVFVSDRLKYFGRPGKMNGRVGVKISRTIDEV